MLNENVNRRGRIRWNLAKYDEIHSLRWRVNKNDQSVSEMGPLALGYEPESMEIYTDHALFMDTW